MREIKFRAWDQKQRKMYYNGLIIGPEVVGSREFGPKGYDEVELMQYTGLKDENEKQIWEGDILKVNRIGAGENLIGQVFFNRGAFLFITKDPKWSGTYISSTIDDSGGIEVIGNIYENPELLKEQL